MGTEEILLSIEKSLASAADSLAKIHTLLADVVGQPPHAAEPEYVPHDDVPQAKADDNVDGDGATEPPSVEEPSLPPLPPPPTGVQ